MEGTAKRLQAVVSSDLFLAFKQRCLLLDVTMQQAIEESAEDWLDKTNPERTEARNIHKLLDVVSDVIAQIRRIV